MQQLVSSLLCLVALCLFVDAQQEQVANQQRTCSGGYKEGDQVDRGRYWYLCQDGQLVPKGCFSDDRKRLNLQESFVTGSYVLSCIIDPNGYLSFAYKGCVFDSKQYAIGDTWDDGKYWFSCSKDGEALRMEVSGCVYESKRYNIGDTLERDQFLYECRRWANNTCSMCPVGCLADGKRYRVGESFEQGQFWYSCTIEDGRVTKKCVGCMHASQRLQDGDRYFQEDAIFECDIRKGVDPVHRIVGCVDQNGGNRIERRVGCQWTHGQAPLQYIMRCEASADEKSIKKETVYCYYAIGNEGGYQIDPGCFKIYDTLILACRKTDAGVLLETFPMTQLDQTYTKGVRMC